MSPPDTGRQRPRPPQSASCCPEWDQKPAVSAAAALGCGEPSSLRPRMLARSNRKPATRYSAHPVAQAFHDHLLHQRVIAVQRIAAAAEIIISAIRRQHIINVIVKAFKGNEGAVLIALRRMVEHHVQNDLDARICQRPDQLLQFRSFPVVLIGRRIAGIGCKKADGAVAPVIETASARPPLWRPWSRQIQTPASAPLH